MTINQDMFAGDSSGNTAGAASKWRMVTNHLNLFYMLATGMIMPPKGFGKKYYQDSLCIYPGWITVFRNQAPKSAIDHAIAEKNHLVPCILEIDLSSVQGQVKSVSLEGDVRDLSFPHGLKGDEHFLLIPAPLPVSVISSVILKSREDKSALEKSAKDFDNVPVQQLKLKTGATEFKGSKLTWPVKGIEVPDREVFLDLPLSIGGILAMLVHMGNCGELAIAASTLAYETRQKTNEFKEYPILAGISEWITSGKVTSTSDISTMLYWGMVTRLVESKAETSGLSSLDVVLDQLHISSEKLDERTQQASSKLIEELKVLARFSENTVSELLERHTKPLSRALILFFLRERCVDLLQFKHPSLTQYDYLLAGILFAVRDTWMGLPLSLRNLPGLADAVTHRMANVSHSLADSKLVLGASPERPKSLRELFQQLPWSQSRKEAALLLARKCKWDCIQTRINLGKGNYNLLIDNGGIQLVLKGETRAVETEVDHKILLENITQSMVPDNIDSEVRKIIKA